MQSTDNDQVNKEVEKLLAPLKSAEPAQYEIIKIIIAEMINDPKLEYPEALTKGIEDKIYRLIDEQVKYI